MATKYVSNAQQLVAALASASGGDTIVLRSGSYGALDLEGMSFASDVTLKSQSPLGAKFTSVKLTDADHLAFDGVAVAGEFRAVDGSYAVKLLNSDVSGGAYFKNAWSLVVENNDISGSMNALTMNDVRYVQVRGNTIHDAQSDLLRVTGDSHDIRIENNQLLDVASVKGDHPDIMQFFAYNGQTPHNVIIRGNVLYDDPATGATPAQGIFLSAPAADGFQNFLIEDNLVNVGSVNSIYVNGGTHNVVVRDNVLTCWQDGTGGTIRLVDKDGVSNAGVTVENNIARQILNETGVISTGQKIGANSVQTVFGDAPSGYSPQSSGTYVSNASELLTALASASGGDTIVLRSGSYGALDLKGVSYASDVTLKSQSALGAKFTSVKLTDADHLVFDGVAVAGEFRAVDGSFAVKLLNSDVNGGAYFKNAWSLVVENNDISGSMNALTMNDVCYVQVRGNTIHDAQSDLLRVTGDSYDIRIENNHLLDVAAVKGDHPDIMQFFAYNGETPHDVVIRGNVLYDDPATGATPAQGIFLSAPAADGFRNFLIEDNLVNVGSVNSIYVNGGTHNVVVRDNVLPVWSDGTGGTIRLVDKDGVSNAGVTVEHNFARQILDETTALSAGLKIAGNVYKTAPMADLLTNWDGVAGSTFESLLHGMSATDLLA
jgi:hypothetical protein